MLSYRKMVIYMTVGERIKSRRIELGLSVSALAKRLGVHRATLYRYENNSIENLPVDVLVPIAEALYVSPAFLMGWEEDEGISLGQLTTKEISLVLAYRNSPAMQEAVDKLLGIK